MQKRMKAPKKETKTVSTRLIMQEYRDMLRVLKSSTYKNSGEFIHDAIVEKIERGIQ